MGFTNEYPEYVLDASSGTDEVLFKAQHIIDEAEVVVLGSAPYHLLKNRLLKKKLTFRYSERLWKQYKHYFKTPIYMLDNYRTRHCRLLCASAFAAYDYNTMGAFKDQCYKWGYFTKAPAFQDVVRTNDKSHLRMMWCSRFLDWKHPELPIYLAKALKDKGYYFTIEMYGSGCYLRQSRELACFLDVDDVVLFCGNTSNDKIVEAMQMSDIFLFTSDRGEGWGVVANEAMGCGSVIVASDEIGSIPYLVKEKENGCTFHSSSRFYGFTPFGVTVDKHALTSLISKVEWLINSPEERRRLSLNARNTILHTWSPENAAHNLLALIEGIKQGNDNIIVTGPCSKV